MVDTARDNAALAMAPAADAVQEQVGARVYLLLHDFVRDSHLLTFPAQLLRQLSAAAAVPLPGLPDKSPAVAPAPTRASPPAAADRSPASQVNAMQVDSQVRAAATSTFCTWLTFCAGDAGASCRCTASRETERQNPCSAGCRACAEARGALPCHSGCNGETDISVDATAAHPRRAPSQESRA